MSSICKNCQEKNHHACEDVYWGKDLPTGEKSPLVQEVAGHHLPDDWYLPPGRRYRNCMCQHSPNRTER